MAVVLLAGCVTGQGGVSEPLAQLRAACEESTDRGDGAEAWKAGLQYGGLASVYLVLRGVANGAFWGAVTGGGAADGVWIGAAVGAGLGAIVGVAAGVEKSLEEQRRYRAAYEACVETGATAVNRRASL
jgi:hypothetical protein